MERKDEDFICFYRDAVIAGHDYPAAETMRRFNLSHDLIVRVLNEAISGCEGQDIPQLEEIGVNEARPSRWWRPSSLPHLRPRGLQLATSRLRRAIFSPFRLHLAVAMKPRPEE